MACSEVPDDYNRIVSAVLDNFPYRYLLNEKIIEVFKIQIIAQLFEKKVKVN